MATKKEKEMKMTYQEMATVLLNHLITGETLADEVKTACHKKLEDFIVSLEKKAEYSATHQKKRESKISTETLELVEKIGKLLADGQVRTSAEIARDLGMQDLTPLRIANVAKRIDNIKKTKKVAEVVNSKGLYQQKEFVAYFI